MCIKSHRQVVELTIHSSNDHHSCTQKRNVAWNWNISIHLTMETIISPCNLLFVIQLTPRSFIVLILKMHDFDRVKSKARDDDRCIFFWLTINQNINNKQLLRQCDFNSLRISFRIYSEQRESATNLENKVRNCCMKCKNCGKLEQRLEIRGKLKEGSDN